MSIAVPLPAPWSPPRAAQVAGLLGIATALAVLLGWALQIDWLRSLVPGAVQMKANTALALALAGGALSLQTSEGSRRRTWAGSLAAASGAIGAATLLQYLMGWQLGIDELLVADRSLAYNAAAGRMSPYTAWVLVMLGLAIALLRLPGRRWAVWLCASQPMAGGAIAALGYLWNAADIVTDAWPPPVALNTGVVLMILALGCLAEEYRDDQPVAAGRPEAAIKLAFLAMVLLLVLSNSATYRLNLRYSNTTEAIVHGQAVRLQLARIGSCVQRVESTAARGSLQGAGDAAQEALLRCDLLVSQLPLDGRLPDGAPDMLRRSLAVLHLAPADADASGAVLATLDDLDASTRGLIATQRQDLLVERTWMLASLLVSLLLSIAVVGLLARSVRRNLRRNLRATAETQEQARLLDAVLDSSRDIIVYRNTAGMVIGCNDAYAALLGRSKNQIIGCTAAQLFDADIAQRVMASEAEVASRLEPAGGEEWLQHADGSRPLFEFVRTPLLEDDGQVAGVLSIGRDITLRRHAEEEVRRARVLAEQVSDAKAAFLSRMSHEIRTPVNAITGLTLLALRTTLTPQQRDYLNKVQSAGQHLVDVVDEVLDFSKLEAGKVVLNASPFSLDVLLSELSSLVGERAAALGLDLVFDVGPAVPRALLGDPLRLRQVLVNYINNAVKFTEAGEVVLRITVDQTLADGVMLRFEVSDTGIGLTGEQAGRLFQDFEQAEASTTSRFGGTGLGLAICKHLAQLMGGAVGVSSHFGAGSRFWFTARLGLGEPAPAKPLPWGPGRQPRALVVETGASARAALGAILERLGLAVETEGDAARALQRVQQAAAGGHPYSCVLLDDQLPGLGELQAAIGSPPLAAVPALFVTARRYSSIVVDAVGSARSLIKPTTDAALAHRLAGALSGDPRSAPAGDDGTQPGKPLPTASGRLRGVRVLLVEDNELNQQVATEILAAAGMEVEVAANGAVGVQRMQHGRFDLVLMDMHMPVLDGVTATARARELGLQVPILAMTANAMAADRERCLAAGMNDFVAKPIRPADLYEVLAHWLPARGTAAAPAPVAANGNGLTLLSAVRGLDVARGLSYMPGGDAGMYLKMLRLFVTTQRVAQEQLRAALAAGDLKEAHRLAHSCKGSSATIGATVVGGLAAELELALAQKRPDQQVRAIARPLGHAADELAAALDALLPS